MKFLFLFIVVLSNCSVMAQSELSPEEILKKIDKNFIAKTIVSHSKMVIQGRRGERTIEAKSWYRGREDAFTEYLAPPRERGTKMLKLGDKLWTYSPHTDRIIQIAGHMLRQSVMGSDLSYEDFMENDHLDQDYEARIVQNDTLDGRNCWILELNAIKKEVAYQSRRIWVDQERFLALKENRYAKSGKLLKTVQIHNVFRAGDRWYPGKISFKDALKQGKGTLVHILSIKFNKELPDHRFSKAALRK